MDPFQGKIGLIGAGAMGGLYGAKLFQAGHDVHFLMRRDYETVRKDGLQILSHMGDFHIRPPVYSSAEALGQCDLVIVGLKTTDNGALPDLLAPVVGPETIVLTLQNGLGNEEEIARVLEGLHGDNFKAGDGEGINHSCSSHPTAPSDQAVGSDRSVRSEETISPLPSSIPARILGGVAFICCNRTEPGVIRHTDHGWIRLAEFSGPARERTHAIAELFRGAGITVEVHDSLAQIRWMKLVWNVPFNGLGVAASHATSRAVLEDSELVRIARGLMEEVIAGARADGVTINPSYIDDMMAATESMGHYKSSMQIDYETGRPLEVEAILGEPVRRARRANLPVPRMEFLYGVVRRLDALRRTDT